MNFAFTIVKVQNRKKNYLVKICFLLMYIKSAWFQLKNWDTQAWLGSQPFQLGSTQEYQLELITNI